MVCLFLVVSAVAAFVGVFLWAMAPAAGAGKLVVLNWPKPLSPTEAGQKLAERGLIQSPRLFAAYLRLLYPAVTLEAGTHLLSDNLSPRELVQRLARLPSRPTARVTMVEGWHHLKLSARLENNQVCDAESFRKAVHDPTLLRELGIKGDSAEGYLFPATYELSVNTKAEQVVKLLVRETRRRLEKIDKKHGRALVRLEDELGWSEREVLTMASLVEKEAAKPEERRIIASVFFNRLTDPDFRPRRMLQSDPPAAYGCIIEPERAPSCADYKGKVLPQMLRDPENRYNTYRHPGLPPGPVANPGEASIEAVLDPADTDYLFFVAVGGGAHTFSRTYDDHERAVQKRREQLGGVPP